MRAATTTRVGPKTCPSSTRSRRPSGRCVSHKKWTDAWGPVSLDNPVGLNQYTYAFADPLQYFDADGHWPSLSGLKKTVGSIGSSVRRTTTAVAARVQPLVKTASAAVASTIATQVERVQQKVGNDRKALAAAVSAVGKAPGSLRRSVANIRTIDGSRVGDVYREYFSGESARTAGHGLLGIGKAAYGVAQGINKVATPVELAKTMYGLRNESPGAIARGLNPVASLSTSLGTYFDGYFEHDYNKMADAGGQVAVDAGNIALLVEGGVRLGAAAPGAFKGLREAPQPIPGGGDDLTRVGRWMSPKQHADMVQTGQVQVGGGNTTRVARPPSPESYERSAPVGDHYLEFDVPSSVLRTAGRADWAQIPGPGHRLDKLAANRGTPIEHPVPACNIVHVATRISC